MKGCVGFGLYGVGFCFVDIIILLLYIILSYIILFFSYMNYFIYFFNIGLENQLGSVYFGVFRELKCNFLIWIGYK